MGKPRIGITMDVGVPDEGRKTLELPADYAEAVLRGGGLPVLIPFTADKSVQAEMLSGIDGLLIPGGADLNPKLYGQAKHPKTKLVDEARESFDISLLGLAEQMRMPTLGICLGSQTMNVYRGGGLHQHLPEWEGRKEGLTHSMKRDRTNFHDVTIKTGSQLSDVLKVEKLQVNSRHHQGFGELGRGLVAAAFAPDGLVEAFEDPGLPLWMAVQWHPENLGGTAHDRIFGALVEAAATFGAKGR